MSVIIRLPCLGCNIFCYFLLVPEIAVSVVGVCFFIVVVLIIVLLVIVIKRHGTKRKQSGMYFYKMLEMIFEFIGMHCCVEPPVELHSHQE